LNRRKAKEAAQQYYQRTNSQRDQGGLRDAFWQMMTNATDTPCQDFYAAIELGVENAMENGTRRPDGGGLA
jgi:hypothetical protein